MKQLAMEADRFFSILDTTLSTLKIDEILTTVVNEIRSILRADRCTLYLVDRDNRELYSKVLQAENLQEIRVSLTTKSLAGYSAITGKSLNVKDAYDEVELREIDCELCFDKSWDEKSGYRTRSVLVVPIKAKGEIVGVFQALNKPGGFLSSDAEIMHELAFLVGIAVNNAMSYQSIEEEKKIKEYIIDDIEEGICIIDSNNNIVSANKFLEIMSGMRYSVQSMIGKHLFEMFPNFIGTQLEEKLREVFIQGFKKVALLEVLEIKIIPYLDDKGRVKKVILVFKRFQ